MAMLFPYRRFRLPHPGITVSGALHRDRPVVDLSLTHQGQTFVREALLDPGADEIVAPEALALLLGIDLASAPTGTSSGVGSPAFPIRYVSVDLRLSDGVEFRTWSALIGFTSARMPRILFGIAHGLEHFTATFVGDRHEVELEVNSSYPGK